MVSLVLQVWGQFWCRINGRRQLVALIRGCAYGVRLMRELALTIGIFLLGLGLRSFGNTVTRKLGAVAILAGSFLGAYFLADGSVVAGCLGVATWFLLPWIEILGRIRHMRQPLRRMVQSCRAPRRQEFPMLADLTREIEECGFTCGEDLGWEHGEFSQFMRLFLESSGHVVVALSFARQHGQGFAFVTLTTQAQDGRVFRTTNLPFGDAMALPPHHSIRRQTNAESFAEMVASHALWLEREGVPEAFRVSMTMEVVPAFLEREVVAQVEHNLERGIIRPAEQATFRYSWRGFVFLWWRMVRDMVRLA